MYLPTLKAPDKPGRTRLGTAAARVYRAGPSIAPWATILAALVAVVSFYYGYRQFRQTQEATRETLNVQRTNLDLQKKSLDLDRDFKAVELIVKYNDLMTEADSSRSSTKVRSAFWRDNSALVIAESIFKLKGDDKGWRETVRWILENHTDFLKDGIDCSTYDEEFIKFLNTVMKCDVCSTAVPCSS